MRILIAPNAMKGSLTADEFANAIEEGLLKADQSLEVIKRPLADGGDGTTALLIKALNGIFVPVEVSDPLNRKIQSRFGWLADSKCAILEMAEASGLDLLTSAELNPMIASSFGTGELINAALEHGAKKIILGIGGSATVDGGLGMLMALGFSATDSAGHEVPLGGNGLVSLAQLSSKQMNKRFSECKIVVATDVKNVLLGPHGAAQVYGPQKGADAQMVVSLEKGLSNFLSILESQSGLKLKETIGGGAAGGIALPLMAYFNARVINGASLVIELLGILDELKKADLVITGEGSLDVQTVNGKGPAAIALAAREAGVPVLAIGGLINDQASMLFDGMFSIVNRPMELSDAMANAYELTASLSFELGKVIRVYSK